MDTTKTTKSLGQVLVSYNILKAVSFVFIILMVLLLQTNRKGFNKSFGYEIFVTTPFLLLIAFMIKEIMLFKSNPTDSFFSYFSLSSHPRFMVLVSILTLFIGILGFFMILYVGGIFSDKPPENNTAMLLNFFIIISFIIITAIIYKKNKNKDDDTLKTFPRAVQDAFNLRTKYTVLFGIFVTLITILYFVNPWGLMTDYGGPVMFFTLFAGIIMILMIYLYQRFLDDPSRSNLLSDTPGPVAFITRGLYILTALGISFGLIYGALKIMGVFDQDASKPDSWGHLIFNLLLFSFMLGIIYKLINTGGFLDKNPYYRFILNTLLYIPCLLVTILNYIAKLIGFVKTTEKPFTLGESFTPPKPSEIKILVLSLTLLVLYFLWILLGKHFIQASYLKQGGKQLINQPIPTDILTNVSSYQSLSGTDKFDYQYAISFWFYLDAFPPSTNASYTKVVPILSYGENPTIKYSSANNTFYITVKQKDDTNSVVDFIEDIKPETISKWTSVQDKINDAIQKVQSMPFGKEIDADGHRIIYKHPDVQLQKWNHILLNYNGGTLDVFYNGQLVKSAIEVVPYMKLDMLTVGTENGISGNVANLMYFEHPLDYLTVDTLYNSLKNSNPPVIPDNKQTLIPL